MDEPTTVPALFRPLIRLGARIRARGREAGQALVEFAMIVPLLVLLLFALVDFGRAFYTWLVVTNAAREGARVAATQQGVSPVVTRINDSISGLDSTDLTITLTNIQGPRGEPVEVDLINEMTAPTAIHWHGIELESYFDGVAGWGGTVGSTTPAIA